MVISDPLTPEVLVQRLGAGEKLSEIAADWQVPFRRLLSWVAGNAELSAKCLRAAGLAAIDLRMEGLELLDDSTPETLAVNKERAAYRERLSRDLNKPLFGTDGAGKGGVIVQINVPVLRGEGSEPTRTIEHAPVVTPTRGVTPPQDVL